MFFWAGSGSHHDLQEAPPPEEEDSSEDLETLRNNLKVLRSQNGKLKAALQAKGNDFIKCGYLWKYRPFASGLFMQPWERRFFVLRKGLIEYYKAEADTQFPPRGLVKLKSCVVEVEQVKKRKFFTFSIIDVEENALALRVSTEDTADGERWVSAMEIAGLRRQGTSQENVNSPRRPLDIRRGNPDPSSPSREQRLPRTTSADLRRRGFWKIPFFPLHKSEARDDAEALLAPPNAKRGPFTGSIPVHATPKFSILSSEEVQNQSHSGLINLVYVVTAATHSRLVLENLLKYGMRFNPVYLVKALLESEVPWQVFACWPGFLWFIGVSYYLEVIAARVLAAQLRARAGMAKKVDGDTSDGNSNTNTDADGEGSNASSSVTESSRRSGRYSMNEALCSDRTTLLLETLFALLQIASINTTLVLPCYIIVHYEAPPIAGMLLSFAAVICWMKLVSYAHCCNDLRTARRLNEIRPGERGNMDGIAGVSEPLLYPENITAKNLAYFFAAPTLTYQVNYPRTSRFRLRWLIRRVIELVAWLSVGAFIVEQYILPSCLNSRHPLYTMDIGHVLERVLKLSLPSLYVWLIIFYCLFHLWMNILAELTYFGDREFYKDWWNATTMDEYWRKWNQPVHKWLMRTVYFPAHRIGMSKYAAILITFTVSAIFHELLVGVPLQMLRAWAFAGMMAQIPLVAITNLLKRKTKSDIVGNIIFWLTFCIFGQPIAVLLYYHDYQILHKLSVE